jgi:hypothetical protein
MRILKNPELKSTDLWCDHVCSIRLFYNAFDHSVIGIVSRSGPGCGTSQRSGQSEGVAMAIAQQPDGSVEDQAYALPFSEADREALIERAADIVQLMDRAMDVSSGTSACGSLGPREVLAALRALEVARRSVEKASTDLLAAYDRLGDSAAHGYRTTAALLAGEFRIPTGEVRKRLHLSQRLTGRIAETGEKLEPMRPEIAREFADGHISADEARTLCDAVESLPPSMAGAYQDRVEKTLVELAPTVRPKDIPALCNRIIQHVDPDGALPVFEPEPHKYNVTLAQQRNGDWRLRGLLSGQTGTTLHALLYGRMKDVDVPVTVKPHAGCRTESAATGEAPGPSDASASDRAAGDAGFRGAHEDATSAEDYSGTAERDDDVDAPGIPLEAVWESTEVKVFTEGRVEIEGTSWTLDEDELPFVYGPDGWFQVLPERILAEVRRLLPQARARENGMAESVIWAKIPGRLPTGPPDPGRVSSPEGSEPQGSGPKGSEPQGSEPQGSEPEGSEPPESEPAGSGRHATSGHPSAWPQEASSHRAPEGTHQGDVSDPRPRGGLAPSGVCEDGQRSDTIVPDESSNAPGIARHDRFAFLLRCVARERVLHGADHALVISARPEDLTRPHRPLGTQTGTPVTLASTEKWSGAAQTFLHLLDGGGRTAQILSQGRFATRTQMAVLAARDQGCTFPDCDAPAEWCEAHHIEPWARGGQTTVDNLTLLCPFHHRWFEGSGWESTFRSGLPAWTPPAHVDRRRRPLFHARFRVALLNLQPRLWADEG